MELFAFRELSFFYPNEKKPALNKLSFSVSQGEFLVLCGVSGCGKSTLLRHLKSCLTPKGVKIGEVLYRGKPLSSAEEREQAQKIGFVLQSPEHQLVTEKVWHELAFGLESLGEDTPTIRRRVAETAAFFGIDDWFYRETATLSGGEKQLLNLASVMTMSPDLLVLDEPTAQLDPIAASEFLSLLGKINRELGVTVILSEHRLEDVFPFATRALVMEQGSIVCDGTPRDVGLLLKEKKSDMFLAMPTAMRVWASVESELACPVSVRDGAAFLSAYHEKHPLLPLAERKAKDFGKAVLACEHLSFRYEKNSPDVLKDFSFSLGAGEIYAMLGGNGAGKSTAVKLLAGIKKPQRGKRTAEGSVAVLPQNPQSLFVKSTVREDLDEAFACMTLSSEEKERRVANAVALCSLTDLLARHPYDLSGGEMQRAALAKLLLVAPRILLLDEPTKGFDAAFKKQFGEILQALAKEGVAILLVSHDLAFCAEYADRCGLFFDGGLVAEGDARGFFAGNRFYTTPANRMARHLIPEALTANDLIACCGGKPFEGESRKDEPPFDGFSEPQDPPALKKKQNKKAWAFSLAVLLSVPLTLLASHVFLDNRHYNLVALLVLFECMLPFFLLFEGRKPGARELVVIAVFCALGIAGRGLFLWLPHAKPTLAVVIIAGVAFGGQSGFLVGALTMLTSNMLFGQGPWTPFQMFAMGLVGFLAGVLFRKVRSRWLLALFGAFTALVIYGGIMNPAAALMGASETLSLEVLLGYYVTGLVPDLIHAAATVLVLWVAALPILEKTDRIKLKYDFAV